MIRLAKLRPFGVALWAAVLAAAPAAAEDTPYVTYEVKRGDTLYQLSRDYMQDPGNAITVQKLNRVRDARYLPVNSSINIPRELLRFERIDLRVAGFSGPVEVAGRPPSVGAALNENQIVTTGRGGFISFQAANGTQVSLPSNARARLLKARRYLLNDIIDIDFAILSGRGEAVSPKLGPQGRMQMSTPTATTAVRGTEFRVAHNEAAGRSLTEVVTGEVGVAAGGEIKPTLAGFGVASTSAGVGEAEAMLPAPQIDDPTAVQTAELLTFKINPSAGAAAYRAQIAKDAGFLEVVSEKIVSEGTVEFESLENRRYNFRARAISPTGIEGFSETHSFKRKRLGVAAEAGKSPLGDGFLFKWAPQGGENALFAFQLWQEGEAGAMIVDETGLSTANMTLTELPNGVYHWRVAAMEADEDGLLKIWGPTQKLNVSE